MPVILFLFLISDNYHVISGLEIAAPKTLFGRIPRPYPSGTVQPPQVTSSSGTAYSHTISRVNKTATPWMDPITVTGPVCLVGETLWNSKPCTYTQTVDGPPLTNLDEHCVLWDSSCHGDKNAVAKGFFEDTAWRLSEKACFMRLTALPECTKYYSPKTISDFSKIKDWMRTPQCTSLAKEFGGRQYDDALASCCDVCYIGAKNVDVYYWPEPGADTSCLSIIGDEIKPVTDDATTESGLTYWGCTAKNPTMSVLPLSLAPSLLDGSGYTWVNSVTVKSIITTAEMNTIGPITFKRSLYNPWSPPECLTTVSSPQKPTVSLDAGSLRGSIHARGHSLVIPISVTQENGQPVSTVVSGQFTL